MFPNNKMDHLEDFVATLYNWGIYLENTDRVENLCKCYIQAMTQFPESIAILNNFGAHLLRYPTQHTLIVNVQSLTLAIFRLGESDAAKRYIELAYNLDNNFLPAEKNYLAVKLSLIPRWHFRMLNDKIRNTAYCLAIRKCIDSKYNDIVDIGTGSGILSVFAAQAPQVNSITAIEESKTLCKIAKSVFNANDANVTLVNKYSTDLRMHEVKGNLLIAEIFDAALFGEHILETLIHAWNFVLDKEDSKVIPQSADMYIVGINSAELWKTHKLLENIPEIALDVDCVTKLDLDPYDAENLKEKDVEYVTNFQPLAHVNFSNHAQLEQMYFRKDYFQPVTLKCKKDGIVQALAVWFDLNLDAELSITSSPFIDNAKCWDQAIFYLNHPIEMKKDETIEVQACVLSDHFRVKVLGREDTCTDGLMVSQKIVKFLNDKKLVEQISKLADSFNLETETWVLDLNVFPLFGLLMAKRGAKVYCVSECSEDREFLSHLSTLNGLDDNFRVVVSEDVERVVDIMPCMNFLFLNPITDEGVVSEHHLSGLSLFCRNLSGEVLPNSIRLVFEIIESERLEYVNKVVDDNVLGFRVAEFFEDYVAGEQPLVGNVPHSKLSQPMKTVNIMRNSDDPIGSVINVPIGKDGTANAILYWYDIKFRPGISYSTKESTYCTRACFLLKPKKVAVGDVLKIKFRMHKGFVSLSCAE